MRRELDALLRAYAESKRRQAECIEKFARALGEVEAADSKFQRACAEAFRVAPMEPSRYERETTRPLSNLFRELDELSDIELDAMSRAHP